MYARTHRFRIFFVEPHCLANIVIVEIPQQHQQCMQQQYQTEVAREKKSCEIDNAQVH